MQFLTFLALAVGLASAADLCNSCGSNRSCCNGIQEGQCCNLNAGTQVQYKLPANSRGQGWTASGCKGSSATFKNANAATRCVTFSWNVASGKWLTGGGTKREAESADEACADPNVAYYQLDGEERVAQIPEGKVQEVEQWIADGEWAKLKALEA